MLLLLSVSQEAPAAGGEDRERPTGTLVEAALTKPRARKKLKKIFHLHDHRWLEPDQSTILTEPLWQPESPINITSFEKGLDQRTILTEPYW
jgi:hypothetical protein